MALDVAAGAEVLVVGGQPAALACAARLLEEGASVTHLFPCPWGLVGASRDIGLAYPELGEPLDRLIHSLGESLAREYLEWGKAGIERLTELVRGSQDFRRGSRLSVTRNERESSLCAQDALDRQRFGHEVRLMSGAAASNYAPLGTSVQQASFETHAAAFVPASLCELIQKRFVEFSRYRPMELPSEAWPQCRIRSGGDKVEASWGETGSVQADVAVVAAGHQTGSVLDRFQNVLVPLLGQAFRSEPLPETTRTSVVGVTASWGFERYRFDAQRRLLGCGIDPAQSETYSEPVVLAASQDKFWQRALTIFGDLHRSGPDILRWGVLFTTTCDGLPILGPLPGEPRIHVAAGFSTSTWSRGFEAGHQVAAALLGGDASELLQRCSPRRFL